MSRARMLTLALATSTLLAVGCGKSTHSTTTTTAAANATAIATTATLPAPTAPTATLARATLIARADAICHQISGRIFLLKYGKAGPLSAILPQIVTYEQTFFNDMSNLTPPASLAHEWNAMLVQVHTLASSTATLNYESQTNTGKSSAPLFEAFARARRQLHAIAARNGFSACAHY